MEKVFKKNLKKKIDSHRIISFDIFDTLIKRNCHNPFDIFDIVEKKYNNKYKKNICNFKTIRINAEKEARKNSFLEEVTLEEIYSYINLDKKVKNILLKSEIETEINFCVQNKRMYEVYKYCLDNNKKIICISDMYLSKDVIFHILKKNGYDIKNVFLSSEVKKQKKSGNLYKYVLDTLNVNKNEILHIGDSKRGDYLKPMSLGIKSYLIHRNVYNYKFLHYKKEKLDLNSNILYSIINNNVYKKSDYYCIGYEILGPLVCSFSNWLYSEAQKNKIEKLFFCARDMQFTQNVFNIIYDNEIKNEYLYISRKSLERPFSYANNNFECFISTITNKKLTMKNILKNKGIVIDNLDELLVKYNIDPIKEYNNKTIRNLQNIEIFYEEVLSKYIDNNFKNQYKYFLNYMKNIGFNSKTSAIVDLGWKGTIQYSLNKIYDDKVKGFYLGLEDRMYEELHDVAFGFIFSKYINQDISEKIYSFRSLFEMLYSATHGTTLEYTNDINHPYILGDYENKNSNVINEIQAGALDFVKNYKEYTCYIDNIKVDAIINELLNIGINPTYSQTIVFGNLNFDNMICGKLAKPMSIGYYIFHIKELKNDIFNSEWKVGFLKRLLRIKLPYYKIYSFLKKGRDKM